MNIFTSLQKTAEWLAVMFCQWTLAYIVIHFQNVLASKEVLWHLIIHEFAWLSSPPYFFFFKPQTKELPFQMGFKEIFIFPLFKRIIRIPWWPPSRKQRVLDRNFVQLTIYMFLMLFKTYTKHFPEKKIKLAMLSWLGTCTQPEKLCSPVGKGIWITSIWLHINIWIFM